MQNKNSNSKTGIFLNFSNHPSCNWSNEQMNAAREMIVSGQIMDIAFPQVSGATDEEEVHRIAISSVEMICSYCPTVVMCQGEFGLTYQIVTLLKEKGIKTVYSCSERRTIETRTNTGTEKLSVFCFVRFREY